MKALFGKRWLWVILALIFFSAVIWYGGPYILVADYAPLGSELARIIGIVLLIVFWGLRALLRELKAARASKKLVQAVAKQEEPANARASADARQMQQRFEEATNALQKSSKGKKSLYDLPWYIIIGPPGAGKTTAIVNSGLNFPLAQKFGKEALRGVGGTRNCDWWFTDRAILLDTAGRYTTQDSNARADGAGWVALLQLLRKFRSRQPINGVIVALSASDLLTGDDKERERHVTAIRTRLDEISQTLRIAVPVYVLVTKCDLVAGFAEFFDDLGQDARGQVWGTTFPIEATESGRAPELFEKEFSRLLERLQQHVLGRMERERDTRRRVAILAFPQQMATVGPLLNDLLKRVFTTTGFDNQILLRGVYFTSGTQEGTPVDRVLGAVARAFGVTSQIAPAAAGRGKAYFIERLLKNVVFRE